MEEDTSHGDASVSFSGGAIGAGEQGGDAPQEEEADENFVVPLTPKQEERIQQVQRAVQTLQALVGRRTPGACRFADCLGTKRDSYGQSFYQYRTNATSC